MECITRSNSNERIDNNVLIPIVCRALVDYITLVQQTFARYLLRLFDVVIVVVWVGY